LKTWGKADNPAMNALIGVTFLVFFKHNDDSNDYRGYGVSYQIVWSNTQMDDCHYYVGILLWIILRVQPQKKYLDVCKQYRNERKNKKRRKLFYIWLYVVLSFLVPIFLILWLR